MSTELQLSEDQKFWQQLFYKVAKWEVESLFQSSSRKAIAIPTEVNEKSILEIPRIEKEIKNLKNLEDVTKEERLGYTRAFTDTSKRLMVPEKTYESLRLDAIRRLTPLKIAEQAIKDKIAKRAQELVDFKAKCLMHVSEKTASAKFSIQETISKMYSDCLNDETIQDPSEVIDAYENSFDESNFQLVEFYVFDSDVEMSKIYNEVYDSWNTSSFYEEFKSELRKAFATFEVARKDIKKAEEDRKFVEEANNQIIGEEKIVSDIFIPTKAPKQVFQKTSTLKKILVLDTENLTVYQVLHAFAKVLDEAEPYYKGRNYLDMVEPIMKVIEAMKNKNPHMFKELPFNEENKF